MIFIIISKHICFVTKKKQAALWITEIKKKNKNTRHSEEGTTEETLSNYLKSHAALLMTEIKKTKEIVYNQT